MIRVAGVDLSYTSTGVWVDYYGPRDDSVNLGSFDTIRTTPKDDDHFRVEAILVNVLEMVDTCDLVVIEGYSYNAKHSQAHKLGELGGVVKHYLWKLKVPTLIVPPTVLKKWMTGKGNTPKDQAFAAWSLRNKMEFSNNDVADAHALYTIGKHLVSEPVLTMPTTHLAALKDVALPALFEEKLIERRIASASP